MTHHGQLYLRDEVPPRSVYYEDGKFGRLFPWLPPFTTKPLLMRDTLLELGKPGGRMDPGDPPITPADPLASAATNLDNTQNAQMVVGFTFLGQFLDHDMTFDPTSSLERQQDPESIANFRTPVLELDSIYGSGRAVNPHLYDVASGRTKFLIEKLVPSDATSHDDLPRNSQQDALIADPRNDENTIISQLHLAFLKFHNHVVDHVTTTLGVTDPDEAFMEAQRLVRWHYQWIILHEFLPATVGQPLVNNILNTGPQFYNWRNRPFIPVEFSVAAYRFGHSQVRPGYQPNVAGDNGTPFGAPIFDSTLDPSDADPDDLRGRKRAARRFVDWNIFFDFGDGKVKRNKRIDTTISSALFRLPFNSPGLPDAPPLSLAQRNLLRHLTFSLPSGQDVARAMGIDPLSAADLAGVADLQLDTRTPLWFYILKEAEVLQHGRRLGPVGGRIVAEVFIGLLKGDHRSYLRQHPRWKPTLGHNQDFKMTDLLTFAGVGP